MSVLKSRQYPSVMRLFQNFSLGLQAKMLIHVLIKFHKHTRTIIIEEVMYKKGSTVLLGAKMRWYCKRMTALISDIAGPYRISSSHIQ